MWVLRWDTAEVHCCSSVVRCRGAGGEVQGSGGAGEEVQGEEVHPTEEWEEGRGVSSTIGLHRRR